MATKRIYQELVKREIKIQGDILALYPLVKSVPHSFIPPFRCSSTDERSQILAGRIRFRTTVRRSDLQPSHQVPPTHSRSTPRSKVVIRESRRRILRIDSCEIHQRPLSVSTTRKAVQSSALLPLRCFSVDQDSSAARTSLEFVVLLFSNRRNTDTTSYSVVSLSRGVIHDALVLSHRLTRDEEGRAVLNGRGFLRYWFFLSAFSEVGRLLQSMEADLRILFEPDEDNHF